MSKKIKENLITKLKNIKESSETIIEEIQDDFTDPDYLEKIIYESRKIKELSKELIDLFTK